VTTAPLFLVYCVFALGGAAVYLLMPRSGRSNSVAGAILGMAAIALLIVLVAGSLAEPGGTTPAFCVLSVIAVFAAARVITHTEPVYSALYFVLVVVTVSALLVLLAAEFAAVALLIIYAGAIMVTYLFVIMLARQAQPPSYDRWAREPFMAVLAGFLLMAAVAARAGDLPNPPVRATVASPPSAGQTSPPQINPQGNTAAIGHAIMTRYVVVLELAGILLLIAMIGAIALSTKKVPLDTNHEAPRPYGEIGKEVLPF